MNRCPVPECAGLTRPDELLCKLHWFRVPSPMRAKVWREYRRAPGSAEHLAACEEAIQAAQVLAPKTGRDTWGPKKTGVAPEEPK